jgi:hypothetical protein
MTSTQPPGPDWQLVARRRITADKIYNAGCAIDPAKLGQQQLQAMLRTGLCVWLPPNQPTVAAPVDLPEPPAPPAKRPRSFAKVAVMHPDLVTRWHLTFAETRKHFETDAAAMDWLMGHQEARDLYKLACKVGVAEAKAKYKGKLQSISPNEVGL